MNDKEDFLKSIRAYNLDTRPFELRFLQGFKGVYSGYFNNLDDAYNHIKMYWRRKTCYFTLQDIDERIVARCENNMGITKKVTANNDIKTYRFIHVDIDPVRPSGIQASKEEARNAYKRAEEIKDFLSVTAKFPDPLMVFSGNGTTLDYRFETPIDVNESHIDLVKSFLASLSILFSDDKADVDTTVCNPARIIKLPGTISKKGIDTKDRPHRYSQIIDVGDTKGGVSVSQVEEIASIGKEMKT